MSSSPRVVLFGDQTNAVEHKLQGLIAGSSNVILAEFLNAAFRAIQKEIYKLPSTDGMQMPRSETLGLLIDAVQSGKRHAALDNALLCMYEVGLYLSHVSRCAVAYPPPPSSTTFAGVCIGSLAAASLSCAQSSSDISCLGVQAVKAAFRIGLHIYRKGAIEGYDAPESWSTIVFAVDSCDANRELETYCREKKLPTSSRPYVSSVSPSGVTISGPPAVLNSFLSTAAISTKQKCTLPLYGPYHSENGYSQAEVDRVRASVLQDLRYLDRPVHTSQLSCVSGTTIAGSTFRSLLETATEEILTRQIRLDKFIDKLADMGTRITLTPINMQIPSALSNALTRKGVNFKIEMPGEDEQLPREKEPETQADDEKIAIIGYSGRFPEADGLEEFWELLKAGLDVHKPVPATRFDAEAHYDASHKSKNTSRIKHGCWLKNPGLFDAKFFRLSPREATQTDPAHRLALVTAYEALEMAGFVADRTPSSQRHRVGVYYGSTSDDWREVNDAQNIDTYFIPGTMRAFMPGRINYHFKFSGPSVSVDTACSSSLATINIAISALLRRDCDTAIAGGTSILTGPDNFAGLDRGHFLSLTGNCKTFDDGADGYCRAEGIGTVVMKRLSDAIADKDPIFGVVLGAQTNHSADAVSITRPESTAQTRLFRSILNKSKVDPLGVSYVEMHGTGTQAGDAAEMESVLKSFAWDHSRGPARPLYLGSVKSNIGHGESASGVMSLVKVLLMMKHNKIPPHCGIKSTINRGFPKDLRQRSVRIELKGTNWSPYSDAAQGKRRAFINNFSAAGGNTALLLEDAPEVQTHTSEGRDCRTEHVVVVSARSRTALKRNLAALAIGVDEDTTLSQLAYTTTARRLHHNYRFATVANSIAEVKQSLLTASQSSDMMHPIPTKAAKIGLLFTGQGAQYTGMASGLFQNIASFRDDILDFNQILITQGFSSMMPLIEGDTDVNDLPPTVVQAGACIIQMALTRLWANLGVTASYVIGHSLGEYAAMYAAGILSISDAIYLCASRARLLEQNCSRGTHGMIAVRASEDKIRSSGALTGSQVEVSCINGPQDTVLSGDVNSINTVYQKLTDMRYSCNKLTLPFAFHSPQVDPVLSELEETAKSICFKPPKIPFVSTLLGNVVQVGDNCAFGPAYIARHCREPVKFLEAAKAAQEGELLASDGVFIEIGAHPVLSRLIGSMPDITSPCCVLSLHRRDDDFTILSKSLRDLYLAGVALNWDAYHDNFPSCHMVLTLPTYSWDLENYWHQYQGNWCLRRGDPAPSVLPAAESKKPVRLSSSVHEIVEEITGDHESSIVSQSDVRDPELLAVADGHRVNGLVLIPSGLYADVAYTLTSFLVRKKLGDDSGLVPDVGNMLVEKALIVENEAHQYFRASIVINWQKLNGKMELYSVDTNGMKTKRHATCTISIDDASKWQSEWRQTLYMVKRSIRHLEQQNDTAGSTVHKVRRGMAYKLFAELVEYGDDYQGMQEVIFDSKELEGSALVHLNDFKGSFFLNPYWYDSVAHLTGYLLHSNDILDLKQYAYINQGWDYLRLAEPLDQRFTYRTYVKMHSVGGEGDTSSFSGNLFILRDDMIVGKVGGLTFNRVPRRVLNMLLPPATGKPVHKFSSLDKFIPMKPQPSAQAAALTPKNLKVVADGSRDASSGSLSTVSGKALRIIADQIGVEVCQMTDDVVFTDYGVDSLLSLTIIGSLQEALEMQLPGTLFDDFTTVTAFKNFLADAFAISEPETACSSSGSEAASFTSPPSVSDEELSESSASAVDELDKIVSMLLVIMEEETGVSRKDLDSADNLGDYGVDSLISLTVVGRARQELGIEVSNDMFLENSTIGAVRTALAKQRGTSIEPATRKVESRSQVPSSRIPRKGRTRGNSPASLATPPSPALLHPQATSIVLQGSTSSSCNLFLFPDGSGSATSAVGIPAISADVRLYGLNCPYVKNPLDLHCALQDLTASYVAEIRRRQPRGPYNLAGWSAGGISAFHAAQILTQEGDKVDRLVLIDAPNPLGIEKLPARFFEFLETAGVFGAKVTPKWLTQHFASFNEALVQYHPTPFQPAEACPRVTIIWAKDGLLKRNPDFDLEARPGDVREMRWLLDDRKQSALGPNGWDKIIPQDKIQISYMEDADHFNMVRQPAAARLADAIRGAMRVS
ncbi:hypothetical protein PWT90_06486 [Aphanocladium album]|nr:hypothetical protein PWT90_06486 [Aphanocladium album]